MRYIKTCGMNNDMGTIPIYVTSKTAGSVRIGLFVEENSYFNDVMVMTVRIDLGLEDGTRQASCQRVHRFVNLSSSSSSFKL